MPIRGETIGTAYVRVLADGSGFDDDLEKQSAKAGKKAGDAYGSEFDKSSKSWEEAWMDRLMDNLDKRNKKMVSENRKYRGQITKITKVMLTDIKVLDKFWTDFDNSSRRALKAFEDAEFAFSKPVSNLRLALMVTQKKFKDFTGNVSGGLQKTAQDTRIFFNAVDEGSKKIRVSLNETRDHFDKIGDSVARAFGKGSRNNFINFMGVFIGRMASLPGLLAGAGSGIIGFGNKIKTTFDKAGGGIGGLFAALQMVVRSAGFAGIALTGLTAIVGIFTSAIILASGVVIALASSLSFALVGAIGLVVGAMVPLVAGLGVTVAAFASMDKAAKDAFKGVTDAFKGLGDTAADTMFKDIGDSAQALEGVIKSLNPLVEALAGAVRDVFDGWIAGVQSKEFQGFIHNLTTTLPDMIRSLGEIAGNVGQGLANIWIVASPHVQEFLGWLAGVTQGFADLNTVQGGKLDTFFDNTAESLKAVAGFLEQVISLTTTFFSAGKDTGDQIFRDIGDAIEGWVTHLRENPDILENFFRDAKKFAGALGNVVEGAAKLIDTLDSPATRRFAITLTEGIGDGLKLLADLIGPVVGLLNKMDSSFANVAIGMGAFALAFPRVTGAIGSFATSITPLGRNLTDASTKMDRFKAAGQGAIGIIGAAGLVASLTSASDKVNVLGGALSGAAVGFSVGGPLGAGIGAVAGGLAGVATQAIRSKNATEAAAKAAKEASTDYDALAASLNQVSGAFTEMSAREIAQQVQTNVSESTLQRFNTTANTVTQALLGNRNAQSELSGVRAQAIDQTAQLEAQNKTLHTELVAMSDDLNRDQAWYDRKKQIEDTTEANQKVIDQNTKMLDSFEEIGAAFEEGATKIKKTTGAAVDWTATLGKIPKKAETQLALGNFPTTFKNIKSLFKQYDIAPKRVRTYLEATGVEMSERKIKRLIRLLNDTGGKRVKPQVQVDTTKPVQNIEDMKRKLVDTGKIKTNVQLKADKTDATNKMSDVKKKADDTNKLSPNVKVTADTNQASQDLTGIKTQVDNLPPSKTITITTNYVTNGHRPTASGGLFLGPENRLIGEAGPEAVVPLSRPLSQVDPAVRQLSAIAQGLTAAPAPTTRATVDMGGVTIITPTKNPAAVAQEVMNRLVAVGY